MSARGKVSEVLWMEGGRYCANLCCSHTESSNSACVRHPKPQCAYMCWRSTNKDFSTSAPWAFELVPNRHRMQQRYVIRRSYCLRVKTDNPAKFRV